MRSTTTTTTPEGDFVGASRSVVVGDDGARHGASYLDEDGDGSSSGFAPDDSYGPGEEQGGDGGGRHSYHHDPLIRQMLEEESRDGGGVGGGRLSPSFSAAPLHHRQQQLLLSGVAPAASAAAAADANRLLVRSIASFMTLSDRSLAARSLSDDDDDRGGGGDGDGGGGEEDDDDDSWWEGRRRAARHRRRRRGGGRGDAIVLTDDEEDEDGDGGDAESDDGDDSWVVGVGIGGAAAAEDSSWWSGLDTPSTPGLVAISPLRAGDGGGASASDLRLGDDEIDDDDDEEEESEYHMERLLLERRRKWAQDKLVAAVFSHPQPLRSFCSDAYRAAQDIRRGQQLHQQQLNHQRALAEHRSHYQHHEPDPETSVEPSTRQQPPPPPPQQQQHSPTQRRAVGAKRRNKNRLRLLGLMVHRLVDFLFHNVPLSVLLDVAEALGSVSVDTSVASFRITLTVANGTVSAMVHATRVCWDAAINFNPFHLIEALISFQFNAMGKTSEALVSGIQSVTTGVESASSLALHRLSAANLSLSNCAGSAASVGANFMMRAGGGGPAADKDADGKGRKLLRKMSSVNEAARVVAYRERPDDTGGLTRQAMSRTRRMMHYSVSLRPFVATVAVKPSSRKRGAPGLDDHAGGAGHWGDGSAQVASKVGSSPGWDARPTRGATSSFDGEENSAGSVPRCDASVRSTPSPPGEGDSPLICSPQSFPPTPRSRQMVLARGSQFADDVVFLARDRLRVHDGLESSNERTREMAWALKEGKRLAVFDSSGVNGIELTCGQHIATKVGNVHYASTRSMVPVLRNCYVYFEVTVMPRLNLDLQVQNAPVTLSIGLSTLEMPPNTLLGSWQGSVGICTTGQILVAGQWCSPEDPSVGAYGHGATVGCLVFLDDSSSFETWDGVMVNASVSFSINGVVVPNPLPALGVSNGGASSSSDNAPGVASSLASSGHQQPSLSSPSRPRFVVSPTTESWANSRSSSSNPNGPMTPTLLVPASEELYPTVTLQTPATAVMCRFSSEDVLLRDSIGPIPRGATVYAVDGSVIMGPDAANAVDGSVIMGPDAARSVSASSSLSSDASGP